MRKQYYLEWVRMWWTKFAPYSRPFHIVAGVRALLGGILWLLSEIRVIPDYSKLGGEITFWVFVSVAVLHFIFEAPYRVWQKYAEQLAHFRELEAEQKLDERKWLHLVITDMSIAPIERGRDKLIIG